MEEMIKIIYRNFLDNESDAANDKISKRGESVNDALGKMKEVVSEKIYDEVYDSVYASLSDVKEQAFISGFAYCAKMMSAGKVNIFDSVIEG